MQKIIFHFLLFLFLSPKCKSLPCNKTHPIFKNDKCDSIYCTEEEFNSSRCSVNNEIIKTQWLTNIIEIGGAFSRYIHPFLTSNNDLIIETISTKLSGIRNFYGLTNEGRFFFKNSEWEETPYYSISMTNVNLQMNKYEGSTAAIQMANDNTNYFLRVGINNTYAELIDYKKNQITKKLSNEFYYTEIISEVSSIFLMKKSPTDNDQKKYYILSFIIYYRSNYYFQSKIYYFNSSNITNGYTRVKFQNVPCAKRKITSCFQSSTTYYIFCFYQNTNYEFTVIVYQPNLELEVKKEEKIGDGSPGEENENIFFKCIYLINNMGFYLYYTSGSSTSPNIAIREWDGNDSFKGFKNSKTIYNLNIYALNSNLHLNDLIRIKESQISFASLSENKEILYITTFNFYSNYSELIIRYYSFPIYELYHKKFFMELKLAKFSQFLTLASSFCPNQSCSSNSDEHSSYLMIFGYPNSTDINFDYIQFLNKTNQNIENNSINLRDYITEGKIDNNIFGYVFKGIKILSVPNRIILKSITYNASITSNYFLKDNEIFSISIPLDNQNDSEKYNIKYAIVYSDPKYQNLYDYVTYKNDSLGNIWNEWNQYSYEYIAEYVGRISYFTIIKNGNLTTNCENEFCALCKQNDNKNCIVCKEEYTISNGKKICLIPIETTLPLSITTIIDVNPETTIIIPETDTQNIITTNLNIKTTEIFTTTEISDINTYSDINILFRYENMTKEDLIENLPSLIKEIKIGEYYEIKGNEYNMKISPTNRNFLSNITHIDFEQCENFLRNYYDISESRYITFMQLEIYNTNSKVLVNKVEYQAYDDNKTLLNLSLCFDKNIKIIHSIKSSSSFDIMSAKSFKDLGIDIFNIKDSFFTDVCRSYSDSKKDMTLKDRIKEFFQNYSLCEEGCSYDEINLINMTITCDCRVKTNISLDNITENLIKYEEKSNNFQIIKCYQLFFSSKGKSFNIGFWIFLILITAQVPLLIIYFYQGIKPIRQFLINEMKFYGYINKKNEKYLDLDDKEYTNKKSKTKAEKEKKSKKGNTNKKKVN